MPAASTEHPDWGHRHGPADPGPPDTGADAVRVRSVLATAAALGGLALVLSSALSAQAVTNTSLGNDVSWPQCQNDTSSQGPLPTGAVFGIVGLNDGLANTTNPCFGTE